MKLKDYFTLGNLLSGFLSVIMVIRGEFEWACYLIFIGYVFDVLDGPVARLTKQFDDFGGAFDSASDFVTYSIAPSFIIYHAYVEIVGWHWLIAAAIGAIPISFGTIRQARYAASNMSYPCYWIGLPRPVLSLFILSLLLSSMFQNAFPSPFKEIAYGLVALIILALGIAHLLTFPFISHHGRRWMGMHQFSRVEFQIGSLVVLPLAFWLGWPELIFDKLVFDLTIYVFMGWILIPRTDWKRIRHYLETGERVMPLVHKSHTWRPSGLAVFWEPEPEPVVPEEAPRPEA